MSRSRSAPTHLRSELARPTAVYAAMSDTARIARWWGPDGFASTIHTRAALVATALLLSICGASAETTTRTSVCHPVPFVSFVLSDQRIITIDVSREQIRETPPWDLENGKEPPLAVEEAVRIATAEFGRTVPNPESWFLARINVEVLCDKRAVYMVWWAERGRGHRGQLVVPVLMSGVALSTSSAVAAAKGSEP